MSLSKIITVLTILCGFAFAQLNILPLNADFATFRGNTEFTYVEIYLSFFQDELAYHIEEDSSLSAHYTQKITISNADSVFTQSQRKYRNLIEPQKQISGFSHMMDVFAFQLPPDTYTVTAELFDDISGKNGTFTMEMPVPTYEKKLAISDIQLSTNIRKAESLTNFSNKNNMEIIPNPSKVFGLIYPVLFFYFEAYNLGLDESGNNRYSYHYYITNDSGSVVRELSRDTKSRPNQTIAEATGTNVIALPEDNFKLNITLIDEITGDSLEVAKKFYVRKKLVSDSKVTASVVGNQADEYSAFTADELKSEFAKVKYIATSEEQSIFKELDEDGMRKFLVDFWKRRDTDPATPQNEYRMNYVENLKIANASYSNYFKEGWQTDRGRVLLMYGRPDEIERNPSVLDVNPYEVWFYYSLEGGCEFIFGDLSGHGEYELLHSTYRNEIQDANWRLRLSSGSGGYRIDY